MQIQGIIISYHRIVEPAIDPWGLRVTAEHFAEHLEVLSEFCCPLSLESFISHRHQGTLPRVPVMLTFDDGYIDNLETALPLLEKFDVPATVFVSSGYIDQAGFWWEDLEQIFLRPQQLPERLEVEVEGYAVNIQLGDAARYSSMQHIRDKKSHVWKGEPGSRIRAYHDVYDQLWPYPHAIKLRLVTQIIEWSGMNPDHRLANRPMTSSEVRRLSASPCISIGGHTVTHTPLADRTAGTALHEIVQDRMKLQDITEDAVSHFAYPHGSFDSETPRLVAEAGFASACTTRQAAITVETPLMLLPRYAAQDWSGDELLEKLRLWLAR
jgi:peptidoglycan/xylan/chitin deacetylase (PgdA/CDA1 family)